MIDTLALGLAPLTIALGSLLVRRLALLRGLAAAGGALQIAATLWLAIPVLAGHGRSEFLTWFHVDAIGAWMIAVNGLVYGAAMIGAAQLTDRPEGLHLTANGTRSLFGLGSLFIVAANAVICANDLGAMWVAMEATTLLTAPLVFLPGTRRSTEAAWKYLVLCGVGIGFALFGTVVVLAANGGAGLRIEYLAAHASSFNHTLLNLGFIFFLLGYGTKAGLFPVHNWLPDAHSEAPAPASALLSGALLNCAMVALWRIGGIVAHSATNRLLVGLLVPMGALTVLAAGFMLVRQRDLKRMWAYSSMENMGVLAVAAGLGLAPVFALHALAHSLAKSAAFLFAGSTLREFGTVSLSRLSGVMRRSPALGFGLIVSGAAVMGAPPFGSFVSEWLLLARLAEISSWGIVAVLTAGLTLSFIAAMVHLSKVAFGEKQVPHQRRSNAGLSTAWVLLVASALVFFFASPSALTSLSSALGQPPSPGIRVAESLDGGRR